MLRVNKTLLFTRFGPPLTRHWYLECFVKDARKRLPTFRAEKQIKLRDSACKLQHLARWTWVFFDQSTPLQSQVNSWKLEINSAFARVRAQKDAFARAWNTWEKKLQSMEEHCTKPPPEFKREVNFIWSWPRANVTDSSDVRRKNSGSRHVQTNAVGKEIFAIFSGHDWRQEKYTCFRILFVKCAMCISALLVPPNKF